MDRSPKNLSHYSLEYEQPKWGKFIKGEAAMELNSDLGTILVVADLHIGFEGYTTKGSSSTILSQHVLNELSNLVNRIAPDILLICGDVKDDVVIPPSTITTLLWHAFDELLTYCKNIWIVRGNHDGTLERYLPTEVRMFPGMDALIQTTGGSIGFCHGHAAYTPRLASVNTLILGHSHPSIHLRDQFSKYNLRTWIRATVPSFQMLTDKKLQKISPSSHYKKEIIILPPFNQYLGGFPLNEGGFVPGFIAEQLIHPDTANLYLLDGVFLGSVALCTALFR